MRVILFVCLIQIDYPDTNLLQPFQRHSYCKNELEKLLALEADEYHIAEQIPQNNQVSFVPGPLGGGVGGRE